MPRFKCSLLAAVGLLLLVNILSLIGPKRALAALGFTPIRDVDQPAREPFTMNLAFGMAAGSNSSIGPSSNVPAGKRFVIETISGSVAGPTGQRYFVQLNATTSSLAQSYDIPLNFTYTVSSFDYFSMMQSCRIYCDPGTSIQHVVIRDATSGNALGNLTLSGYLVDLP